RPRRTPPPLAAPRQPHEKAFAANVGRNGVFVPLWRPGTVAVTPGSAVRVFFSRLVSCRLLRACRVAFASLRRQFELAGTSLVSRELFDHRVTAKVSSLLRRRFQNRVSHRIGPHADDQWCGPRVVRPFISAVSARCQWPPARLRPLGKVTTRPAL